MSSSTTDDVLVDAVHQGPVQIEEQGWFLARHVLIMMPTRTAACSPVPDCRAPACRGRVVWSGSPAVVRAEVDP